MIARMDDDDICKGELVELVSNECVRRGYILLGTCVWCVEFNLKVDYLSREKANA
jgi:hypothetical protein